MKCGLCGAEVEGKVRELNRHKAQEHPVERQAARSRRKARVARRGVFMNRCESCQSFVSLEAGEPDEPDMDADDVVTGSVRLALNCGQCGQEMAETYAEFEAAFEIDHTDACEQPDVAVEVNSIEMADTGGGRFSKHLYYAEIRGTVRCQCGAETDFSGETDKVAASSFESSQ